MLAVIKTGGKQYTVKEGSVLDVELLDVEAGAEFKFEEVLLITKDGNVSVGKPMLENASVEVEVLKHDRGDRILVFKKKRRKDYRKRIGHRQQFTRVKVTKIIG